MPNLVSVAPSVAELARRKKSDTQSLNHSPSLFDSPGTKDFALEGNEMPLIPEKYQMYNRIINANKLPSDTASPRQ